ncbi:MAG: hypothetical protein E7137_01890 [Rikenellaceae bacterium]|nr:hypothetical protein [Rikenellaceae bacterium]
MSKNNLFKSMFALLFAFAAVAFVGCKEDIEDVQAPELTVAPAVLNFDELGGSETVQLTANCDWSIAETPSWVDIQPMSGSGNTTLTVTTYPKNENQKLVVYFTLYHPEYGMWGKSKNTLTINQTYGGEPIVEDVFYSNDFDKEAATKTYGSGSSSWPYLDQFDGWQNQTGTGVENVSYSYMGMSARNNSNSDGSYSDYPGSGVNNMFFGSGAYLQIENIAITSTNVNLTFGGEKYLNGSDNLFMPEEFLITLSADGENWSAPIEYTAPAGQGRWNVGSADFTLPEGTTTLWIKFEATVASAYRIDDVKLMGGLGGQQITFDGGSVTPPTPPSGEIPEGAVEATIQEFLDAAEDDTIYVLTGEISRVVKEDWGNFDLTDETATVYIYGLLSPEGEKKVQFQAAGLKQGDKITLYGKRSSYNGEAQMADATYVSHTSGGGEQPGPGGDPVPGEGPYASDSPFVCTADSFSNPAGLGDTTIDGNAATGFKLGTGKLTGAYSATVGVAGDKYLNFYAVAWKGKTATLYVRVDGTPVGEFTLAANDGATSNPPFNALAPAATDHYSVELKGLTASSKIEFSTSPNYTAESNETSGRAIVFGVKLTDEAVVPGGGEEPTPGEVEKSTVAAFLAAADTATTYELTGTISRVVNETYGNFDLTDETGTVYVYGLLTPDGQAQKQWAAAGLKEGDTITLQGVYSEYNGEPQIKNAVYVSHTPGEGGGNEEPDQPVTPAEDEYASDSNFVSDGDQYANPSGLGDVTVNGSAVTGFKLGTGKKTGVFSATAGVSGDKYLNFYAVAWKGKSATLYVRVDGTQVGSFTLAANDGATGNPPFVALAPATTDHYSVKLTGLTASSKIDFSTSANYATEDNTTSGRAIVFGVKLTDEALAPEQGGGQTPEEPEQPEEPEEPTTLVKATVQEFLNAAEDETIYELTGEITGTYNTTYGNFYLKDSTGEVLIYGLLTPEGESQKQYTAAGLKDGDIITLQTVRTSYNGTPQGKNAIYVSHTPAQGGGNEEPEQPVTPAEGEYASDSCFVSDGDQYANPSGLGEVTVNGSPVTGFKLGTGKKTGLFTSTAVGVEGTKTLSFYAVAWKGKSATLYVRVDGQQVGSFTLAANDGATGNPPFVALTPNASDKYSVELTGLTASSKVEFSTSANYAVEDNTTTGRAIVFGAKLN